MRVAEPEMLENHAGLSFFRSVFIFLLSCHSLADGQRWESS